MAVVWTANAALSLNDIIDYIEKDFGNLIAEKYYFKVIETIEDIEINPQLFPVYQQNTETRKAVINKKTILYYKIEQDNIMLLAFYDVRMGTHKL